ncbi:hypothetical protein AX16_004509 [Volvariella volvacea WC 439]|nr:hypothetical protein AX16_004509 [Volvariella volvacea WC 439]
MDQVAEDRRRAGYAVEAEPSCTIGSVLLPAGNAGKEAKRTRLETDKKGKEVARPGTRVVAESAAAEGSSNTNADKKDPDDQPKCTLDPKDLILLLNSQQQVAAFWTSALSRGPPECQTMAMRNSTFVCRDPEDWQPWTLFEASSASGRSGESECPNALIPGLAVVQGYMFDPVCGLNRLIKKVNWKKREYCETCVHLRAE